MTNEQFLLVDARHALRWAADGEFSARITPAMARALLHEEANLLATIELQKAVIEKLSSKSPSYSGRH